MTDSFSEKIRKLREDVFALSSATSSVGWATPEDNFDPANISGKAIPVELWMEAFLVASEFARSFPWLPAPTPGADPEGYPWLTWAQEERRWLALEILPLHFDSEHRDYARYRWNQQTPTKFERHRSDSLNAVADAVRATFVRRDA